MILVSILGLYGFYQASATSNVVHERRMRMTSELSAEEALIGNEGWSVVFTTRSQKGHRPRIDLFQSPDEDDRGLAINSGSAKILIK